MRYIDSSEIEFAVKEAVLNANTILPDDVLLALQKACKNESDDRARRLLNILLENAEIARRDNMALCQDTGLVGVSIDLGQDVIITGRSIVDAINDGIRSGYKEGYFRKSVVQDPFHRINTGDNTPAVIHTEISEGDHMRLTIIPKGAGSENMGQLTMLKPAQGVEGVKDFVVKVVKEAGANACPPVIVGVGVGGNMEKAAYLSKKALLRHLDVKNPVPALTELEEEILDRINRLGIGPQGMGGDTTALGVNIETFPTHIACLPVAVSLGCHCTRRVEIKL